MAHQKQLYKRRSRSVPAGYREIWGYHGKWDERKLRKGLWAFRFRATKSRGSRSYGNFGKGTRGIWDIKARQYIVKTGRGKYQTVMVGYKRPLVFKVKKPRRFRRY